MKMIHDTINPTLLLLKESFTKEIQNAATMERTSLQYIKHVLPSSSIVADGEIFQAMVIGGTIFHKALVKNAKGKISIIKKEEKFQPPFQSEKDFLFFVEKEFDPQINKIALNFAYPQKPVFTNGRLDGILLSGTKENTFGNMVGKQVGQAITDYLNHKYKKDIIVSVANDTICLLLSGLSRFSQNRLAAGIVGTGLNFAFFTRSNELVNLEAANFDKFPLSSEAHEIDKNSKNPGGALFEKEIAGAYLYKHFNLIGEKKGFTMKQLHSTLELDQLAQQQIPEVSDCARHLLERSAQYVAGAIAGITEFKKKDMTFVIEGSLFWYADRYQNTIKKTLKTLLPNSKVTFVKISNSTIVGAAKLVM